MPLAYDLIEATIAQLRSYGSGSLAAAFGDTGTSGNNKFQGDDPANQDPPYLTILEPESRTQYENTGDWIKTGIMAIHIFAGNNRQALTLGIQVERALNDAPLVFSSGTLMYLRYDPEIVRPSNEQGAGIPVERERVIGFRYQIEGIT